MQNILRILRYVVFALIITCNAIIASVAVWNQSVSPESASVYAIDICATCLAALELVFSFILLFLELAGQDSVTGKVWFECTWVSALFVVNLAIASAASAILVTQSCIPSFTDACTSTQTLLSFSWLITFVLLIYALTLFASVYLVRGERPDIWSMHVNQIPHSSPKHKLSSGPPTPVFTTFENIAHAPSLVAPVPRPFRTFPMDDSFQHHSDFDLEYGTEQLEPQIQQVYPTVLQPIQRPHSVFDPEYGTGHLEPQVQPVYPTVLHPIQKPHSEFDPEYGTGHLEPQIQPVYPTVPPSIQKAHSEFDSEYGTEHFEPRIQQVYPTAPRPIQRLPTLTDDNHRPSPSLYPQFIQSALQSGPEVQQHLHERQGSLAQRMPSPPPLANWPRHDVLSQPMKSKRSKDSMASNSTPAGPRGVPSSPEGSSVGEETRP